MRYYEIIREGYKEVQQKYVSAGVDPESVEKTFQTYRDLVNRNQVSGNERNIDWWGKQSFDQFKAFVDEKSSEKSTTQVKRSKLPGKSINLVDNNNWLIVIPLDKDASCFHGKNSDWCTTKPKQPHFENYFYDKEVILIYCLSKKTGGMWAIAAHKDTDQIEMFDQRDKPITKEAFNSQTGLDVDKIVAKTLKHQPTISSSRDAYKEAVSRIKKYINDPYGPFVERNAQIEKDLILTKNGELCVEYMGRVNIKENYPEIIQLIAVKQNGSSINYIKNPSEKVQLAAIAQSGFVIQYINNPSEEVKMAAVTQEGKAIQYIKNPSDEVQIAAVTTTGYAVQHIKNPSDEVKMAAVTTTGYAVQHIKNPSEEVKMAAVTQEGKAIQYIKNPSEEVQMAAVQQSGDAIRWIKKPSEAVQLAAVTRYSDTIRYIKNPSEAVQLAAVTQYPNVIDYIKNPSEKVQLIAIKKHAHLLTSIDNPSEAAQLAAVTQNGSLIKYIKNPSETVQLAAVTQNGDVIYFIVRAGIIPSEQVQLAAVTNFGEAIKYIKNPSEAVKKAAGVA